MYSINKYNSILYTIQHLTSVSPDKYTIDTNYKLWVKSYISIHNMKNLTIYMLEYIIIL